MLSSYENISFLMRIILCVYNIIYNVLNQCGCTIIREQF
nr:MAG TPA: hypothetical protein [Caudoviricetes sp.]